MMSVILKNTGFMMWSGAMSMINSLLVWAIVARYLGPAALGQFTLIMAIYLVFFNVCSLGLGPLIVREVASRRGATGEFLGSMTSVLSVGGLTCGGIMVGVGWVVSQDTLVVQSLMVLSLSVFATALIVGCESWLMAHERASMIAAVNTSENLLKAVVPWLLIHLGFGLLAVSATLALLRVGALIVYVMALRRSAVLLASPSRRCMQEILRQTPAFLFINLLAGLHWQLGTLLLDRHHEATDVAMYGVASRLLVPWTLICVSYAASINPTMCRLASLSLAELGRFSRSSMSNLLALLLPLAAGTYLMSEQVIGLLFGAGYESAAAPLRVLIWSLIPLGMVTVLARSLMATNKQHVDAWGNALAVAVNVALNLVLIPKFGATGVAMAQLISITALCLLEFAYVSATLYQVSLLRLSGRLLVATAVMVVIVYGLREQTIWMIVPLSVVCYAACLMALGWRPALGDTSERELKSEVAS
ncbi:MAG: flippase [Acidobacteriota bacterium]|nr:flippase [Blastocatellia bacterium]MDW8238446.1 flippase [Acidobacteriota bacterium]